LLGECKKQICMLSSVGEGRSRLLLLLPNYQQRRSGKNLYTYELMFPAGAWHRCFHHYEDLYFFPCEHKRPKAFMRASQQGKRPKAFSLLSFQLVPLYWCLILRMRHAVVCLPLRSGVQPPRGPIFFPLGAPVTVAALHHTNISLIHLHAILCLPMHC
jgi:hypothetical protein